MVLILFFLLTIAFAIGSFLWKNSPQTKPVPQEFSQAVGQTAVRGSATEKAKGPSETASKRSILHRNYCANPYTTTCGSSWPSVDPTGHVQPDIKGEVRALRYMRNLIRENPNWTSEQVQARLAQLIYTDSRRKRIEDAFRWVMKALRKYIENQPENVFTAAERQAILDRLAGITLEMPPPDSVYSDAADLITKNTVYYERTPQNTLRLRLGGAYLLNTTSWFNIVYTLSHEIAHAIDPCETNQAGITPKSYEKLLACFVSAGWVEPNRTECGPNEQISEVFADWIAAGIVGLAIEEAGKNYSPDELASAAINATRDLCEQPQSMERFNLNLHQSPKIRIGLIMGQNPVVRRALKCHSAPPDRYCDFESVNLRAAVEELKNE